MKAEYCDVRILMAEDDPDDRMLMRDALLENNIVNTISFVENGEELLDYLYKKGKFSTQEANRPGLILLDLNMPKIDGREALKQIKSDPSLKKIPIIVFTTSKAEEDITWSYNLGVNSFISKPSKFSDLVQVTRHIGNYWFKTVMLPPNE